MYQSAGAAIPEFDAVPGGRSQRLRIRAECDGADVGQASFKSANPVAGQAVPQDYCRPAPGGDGVPIGAEGYGRDRRTRSLEGADRPAALNIPGPDRLVIASGKKLLAVVTEDDGSDNTRMPLQRADRGPVFDLPEFDGIVFTR